MVMKDASQQALLKACYKDSFYINILRNKFHGLCQTILGDHFWILWQREIGVVSDLFYFFLTTVRGSQTLGEEYVCTIQVDASKRKIPSKLQRSLHVLLHCTSPYLIDKMLQQMELKASKLKGVTSHKAKVLILFAFLQKLIPVFHQIHMILFYVEGVYVHMSKRIAGIKHVLIRPHDEKESDVVTFRWLAMLGATQVLCKVVSFVMEAKKEITEKSTTPEITAQPDNILSVADTTQKNKCLLCLDSIRDISTTVCGHVFCWKCIIDCCSVKPECPACREVCPPSRVVRLHHYSPT